MVKKQAQQIKETRVDMRSGHGQVQVCHYFSKDEFGAQCRLCAQLTIAPGASIGMHEHAGEDEVFIIQKGKGLVIDNGQYVQVEAGDAILTGKGSNHSIKNTGAENLVVTAVIMQYAK